MVTPYTFFPFLPTDNHAILPDGGINPTSTSTSSEVDILQTNVQLSQSLLNLSNKEEFLRITSSASFQTFLTTYLKNRDRIYELEENVLLSSNLRTLDSVVLQILLKLSKLFPSSTTIIGKTNKIDIILPSLMASIPDIPSLLDLASLYGPSNPSSVTEIFRKFYSSAVSLSSSSSSSSLSIRQQTLHLIQSIAEILIKDIPQGLNRCTKVKDIEDVLSYICDILHSIAKFFTMNPLICNEYHVQQAGTELFYSPSSFPTTIIPSSLPANVASNSNTKGSTDENRLSIFGAIITTYECTLPTLTNRLVTLVSSSSAVNSTSSSSSLQPLGGLSPSQLRKLQISCHAALETIYGFLDSAYIDKLRCSTGKPISPGASSNPSPSSPLSPNDSSSTTNNNLEANLTRTGALFCSVLAALEEFQSISPFATSTSASSSLAVINSSSYFYDFVQNFQLISVFQSLIPMATATAVLTETQASVIMRILNRGTTRTTRKSRSNGDNKATVDNTDDNDKVSFIQEIHPTVSREVIQQALKKAKGDVSIVIESLLSSSSSSLMTNIANNGSSSSSSNVRTNGIDDDLRSRTLRLVNQQEETDRELAEQFERLQQQNTQQDTSSSVPTALYSSKKNKNKEKKNAPIVAVCPPDEPDTDASMYRKYDDDDYFPTTQTSTTDLYNDEYDDAYDDIEHDIDGGIVQNEFRTLALEEPVTVHHQSKGKSTIHPNKSNIASTSSSNASSSSTNNKYVIVNNHRYLNTEPPPLDDGLVNYRTTNTQAVAEDDDEEDESSDNQRSHHHYTNNPGRGGGGPPQRRGRGGGSIPTTVGEKPKEVHGHGPRAKGNLTEEEARYRREQKSRFGNHNRRRGADRKLKGI